MTKLNLNDVISFTNEQSAISITNSNSALIENFSDTVLSRDGTSPNPMLADFDMNSHKILNIGDPLDFHSVNRIVGLPNAIDLTSPVTLGQLQSLASQVSVAPGVATNIIYNAGGGVFAGDAGFTYNTSTKVVNLSSIPNQTNAGYQAASVSGAILHHYPSVGSGSFSNNVTAGDGLLVFSNGTQNQGSLNISPWNNASGGRGIKLNANGTNTLYGVTTFASDTGIALANIGISGIHTGFEFGRQDGTASTPFIDFHAGATVVDFDSRIQAMTGTGSVGAGTLQITSGTTQFSSTISPISTAALGTSSLPWSNLFLSSGGTVNFGNGQITLSNSTNNFNVNNALSGMAVNINTAVTSVDALRIVPSDFGAGKPYLSLKKESTAQIYSIILWDGSATSGTINLITDTVNLQNSTVTLGLSGSNNINVNGTLNAASAITFQSDISPTSLSADQNDYNPTNLATSSTIRLTSSANVNITGLAGGADGRILIIHNIGATFSITLKNESASSTAANRFNLNADVVMNPSVVVMLQYDSTSSRWRVIGGTGGGGSGAPTTSAYVTIGADATLTAERALTAGSGITITDGGANSTVTVAVNAGTVLQVLQTTYVTSANLTTVIPADDTIPQSTEGTQVLSQAITPASSSNKILCIFSGWGEGDGTSTAFVSASLLRSTTCINAASVHEVSGSQAAIFSITHLDSPATTSSTTYSVRVGPDAGTVRLNGLFSGRLFGGTSTCTLTLMEIKG